MEKKDLENTSGYFKYIIGVCIACLAAVLVLLLTGVFDENHGKSNHAIKTAAPSQAPQNVKEDTLIGIVKQINKEEGVFTLLITETGKEQIFTYDGTTSFTSRYNQPITAGEVPYGEIVEVTFDVATSKLKSCDITDKAWEYKAVGRWKMDKTAKSITIGTKTYQYSDLLYAFDKDGEIDTNTLSTKDQVTIKGMNGQAYSIIVTVGHGYLSLTGYEAFLGGTIEIGYDIITTVTEDMVLPLREGSYKVTVTKDGLTSSKYIKLIAGEDYTLDFSEYKVEKVKTGKCYFDITPSGADLYIDDVETAYTKPIELKYGEYEVRVECAGYQTFYAKLKVANEKEVLTITLVPDTSEPTTSPEPNEDDTTSSTPTPVPTPTTSPTASSTTSPTTSPIATPTSPSTNKITISSPTGAYVYLDDKYKGVIPVTFDKVVGENMKLTLMMTGKDSKTYTVTVKDDNFDVFWAFDQWWN